MPINIRGKEYAEVKERLALFWTNHADWSIRTELRSSPDKAQNEALFLAVIVDNKGQVRSSGWAYEERVESIKDVNNTSWVENCETSAIGRALANLGLQGTTERPSKEEMSKVERMSGSKAKVFDITGGKGKSRSRQEYLESLKELRTDIETATETNGYFEQAMKSRNVKDIKELKTHELKEMEESLRAFLVAIGDMLVEQGAAKISDLSDADRDTFLELLDKQALML